MSIKGFSINGRIEKYDYNALENVPDIPSGGDELTEDIKQALLQLATKVTYIDSDGQTYYDDLYDALYATPKVLASISATFTQTDTIYTTDSVDDIPTKGTLVVTASYSDATSTIVQSGYTLSGTLTQGTRPITVNYQGKTATFNVIVTAVTGVYSITNNLTGCTTNNNTTTIAENNSYTANITASTGYTLTGATVTITMGGNTVTGAFSNGTISIPNVTGDIVITVVATARTITSISAVYSQSGIVYDTATLDSLKSNLVVTATYSDSTTAAIPSSDYTLSGTLVANTTSTITVNYNSLSATFDVAVSHEDTSLYNWDFTKSLSDSKHGAVAELGSGMTQNENGLTVTTETDAYARLVNLSDYARTSYTVELDLAAFTNRGGGYNPMLLTLQQTSTYNENYGIGIKRTTLDNAGDIYVTLQGGELSSDDAAVDIADFVGHTLKWQINYADKITKIFLDQTLCKSYTMITNTSNSRNILMIGIESTSNVRNLAVDTCVTGLRIYEGLV